MRIAVDVARQADVPAVLFRVKVCFGLDVGIAHFVLQVGGGLHGFLFVREIHGDARRNGEERRTVDHLVEAFDDGL